jgi:hypothetical protein
MLRRREQQSILACFFILTCLLMGCKEKNLLKVAQLDFAAGER